MLSMVWGKVSAQLKVMHVINSFCHHIAHVVFDQELLVAVHFCFCLTLDFADRHYRWYGVSPSLFSCDSK